MAEANIDVRVMDDVFVKMPLFADVVHSTSACLTRARTLVFHSLPACGRTCDFAQRRHTVRTNTERVVRRRRGFRTSSGVRVASFFCGPSRRVASSVTNGFPRQLP